MNSKKLNDYLIKTRGLCDDLPEQKSTPLIISDSKGDYLQRQSKRFDANEIEKSVVWLTKKGRNSEDTVEWLISNYEYLHDKYGNFTLYIWTGTCDLTKKTNIVSNSDPRSRNGYWISLYSDYKLQANKTLRAFNRLYKFANLKKFELVILEIPVFCIQECNKANGYSSSEVNFCEQDKQLHDTIDELNSEIRKLNKSSTSPKFNCDLRNSRINHRGRTTRNYVFTYFNDGIHPVPLLAKYWLRRISEKIKISCY